jgi:NhaP-type Na+/H+ or K+/H+ antiporter
MNNLKDLLFLIFFPFHVLSFVLYSMRVDLSWVDIIPKKLRVVLFLFIPTLLVWFVYGYGIWRLWNL